MGGYAVVFFGAATLTFALVQAIRKGRGRLTYRQLQATHPLGIEHFGHKVTVPTGSPLTLPVPPSAALPEPVRQPSGRAPVRRQPPQS